MLAGPVSVNLRGMDSHAPAPIAAFQFRAARAMLGFSEAELAERAGIAVEDVRRIEADEAVAAETWRALLRAVQAVSVEFVDQGVRRRLPVPGRSVEERRAVIRRIQAEVAALPVRDPRSGQELLDALYDETGLPR